MKRLLFLFLLLSSVAYGQRYVYSRATPGGNSSYNQLLDSDIPDLSGIYVPLASPPTNIWWNLTGTSTLRGNTVIDGNIGSPKNLTFQNIGNLFFGSNSVNMLIPNGLFSMGSLGFQFYTAGTGATGLIQSQDSLSITSNVGNIKFLTSDFGFYSRGGTFRTGNILNNTGIHVHPDGGLTIANEDLGTEVDNLVAKYLNPVTQSDNFKNDSLAIPPKYYVDSLVAAGGSYPGPSSGTTGDMLRWDAGGDDLENFTPLSNPCVSADCLPLWDGIEFQAGSFTANDFDVSSDVISLDYTNGQAASGSNKGFLTSADWTTFNGKQGSGLSWLLGSGGTLTAPNTVTGSASNTMKFAFPSLGTTQTLGAGLFLENATAAANGAQQISPSLVLGGNGWGTSGSASQPVRFMMDVLPFQGSNPIGLLRIGSSINGAAFTNVLNIFNSGAIYAAASLTIGANTANSVFVQTNSSTRISINALGSQQHFQSSSSSGTNPLAAYSLSTNTGITASTEVSYFDWNIAANQTWAAGNITEQRFMNIRQPTLSITGAGGTVTTASTLSIAGAPIQGTGATLTNAYALDVKSGTVHAGGTVSVDGNVSIATAGSGLKITEGSNATMGTATLSGGTIVVNTTKVTANSRIFLTVNGGTLTNVGAPYVSARTAGTSFTISSTNVLDTANVAWIIIEPN